LESFPNQNGLGGCKGQTDIPTRPEQTEASIHVIELRFHSSIDGTKVPPYEVGNVILRIEDDREKA
jgi:hypothetical protein